MKEAANKVDDISFEDVDEKADVTFEFIVRHKDFHNFTACIFVLSLSIATTFLIVRQVGSRELNFDIEKNEIEKVEFRDYGASLNTLLGTFTYAISILIQLF